MGWPWVLPIQFVYLDCEEVIFTGTTLAVCALSYCCQRLCYGIRNTTQHLYVIVSLCIRNMWHIGVVGTA